MVACVRSFNQVNTRYDGITHNSSHFMCDCPSCGGTKSVSVTLTGQVKNETLIRVNCTGCKFQFSYSR